MDEKFRFLAAQRSDEELYARINHREKYLPETVESSVEELRSRGEVFDEELLNVIAADMEARLRNADTHAGFDSLFNNADSVRQVEDPDAPAFYTKRVIYLFAILFS